MSTILITHVNMTQLPMSSGELLTISLVFASPLPNPKLWTTTAASFLQTQDCFTNGGWWHDQHILEATGQGTKKEEPKAWEGWWNENIVCLIEPKWRRC